MDYQSYVYIKRWTNTQRRLFMLNIQHNHRHSRRSNTKRFVLFHQAHQPKNFNKHKYFPFPIFKRIKLKILIQILLLS